MLMLGKRPQDPGSDAPSPFCFSQLRTWAPLALSFKCGASLIRPFAVFILKFSWGRGLQDEATAVCFKRASRIILKKKQNNTPNIREESRLFLVENSSPGLCTPSHEPPTSKQLLTVLAVSLSLGMGVLDSAVRRNRWDLLLFTLFSFSLHLGFLSSQVGTSRGLSHVLQCLITLIFSASEAAGIPCSGPFSRQEWKGNLILTLGFPGHR